MTSELRDPSYIQTIQEKKLTQSKTLRLPHSPEALWPVVSNTDMFNMRLGLNPTQNEYKDTGQGGSFMYVETKVAGVAMAYEELPFEWQLNRHLSVERIFHKGLVKYLCFRIEMTPVEGGTDLTLALDYVPAAPAPVVTGIVQINHRQMIKLIQRLSQSLTEGKTGIEVYFENEAKHQDAIAKLHLSWKDLAPDSPIPYALAQYIHTAPDRYAGRLRPFEVALIYDLEPLSTLRFCLMAARSGYLHLRWDMRCPSCKGPKENAEHLNQVNNHAYCPTCVVDYRVGFDQNLELTFYPDPKIRAVVEDHFCAGGPGNTDHLPLQYNLWENQTRNLDVHLPEGEYFFRSLTMNGEAPFRVQAGGETSLSLDLSDGFDAQDLVLAPHFTLEAQNTKPYFQSFQIEDLNWQAHAVTGALVSSLQEFRDLFGEEVLEDGTALEISQQVIWKAQFAEPLDDTGYLDMLLEALRDHDGAEVSRSQDSLMGVFTDPLDALKASIKILEDMQELNQVLDDSLVLSLAFHEGPCEIHNQAGQLTYQGETVEMVDFLLGFNQGHDLFITPEVFEDPDLKWVMVQANCQVKSVEMAVDDAHTFQFYRVLPAQEAE